MWAPRAVIITHTPHPPPFPPNTELLSSGYNVRAVVRPDRPSTASAAHKLQQAGAEIWYGDVTKPATLRGCCDGARAVVSALGVRDFRKTDGSVWTVDQDGSIAVWREAAAAKVLTFVLVATYEGRASRRVEPISEAKEQAVDVVTSEARAAGVCFCIMRPTAFFKDMAAWLVDPLLVGRLARVSGGGAPRINPIAGADVATLIRECIDEGGTTNRELPVGGPEVFTLRGMAELACKVTGRDPTTSIKARRLWPLKVVAPFARVLGTVWPSAAALADGARFVLYSATHDAVGDAYGSRTLEAAFVESVAAAGRGRRGRRTASLESVVAPPQGAA